MKILAYLRVSTNKQDLEKQRYSILQYAHKNKLKVKEFIEVQISSRRSTKERKLDALFEKLKAGDALIVSELSRLGRSLGQVIRIVDELAKNKIKLIAIKENIIIDGVQNMQSKVMVGLFGLFAEIERDLISERTKQGLQAVKAKGQILGRRKGQLGKSRLDGREKEIKELLQLKVNKSSIAKILRVSRATLLHFIKTRKIKVKGSSVTGKV